MSEKRTHWIIAVGHRAVQIFDLNYATSFTQKRVSCIDQFIQVLDAILTFFIGCVMRAQRARVQQMAHDFWQWLALSADPHAFDQTNELRHRDLRATARATSACRLP